MRAVSWRIVAPSYGFEPKGDRRAADKRAAQAEIEDAWEDIHEAEEIRSLWCSYYRHRSPEQADRLLEMDGLPKPPSRERRMPE